VPTTGVRAIETQGAHDRPPARCRHVNWKDGPQCPDCYARDEPPIYSAPRADDACKRISAILVAALSGSGEAYRTADGFIRWGRVETDMHAAIRAAMHGDDARARGRE
jgi:hypothetical protein